jgi:hypothetical protein
VGNQEVKINALVLGKSGVGKSSLLNYLWGDTVRAAGTGRPVTPRSENGKTGIYALDPFMADGHEIVVYDSHGLEADKAHDWIGLVKDEMDRREQTDDPEKWFHAVIYCIDAKKSRLDDFEIEHVMKPILAAGHPITVVFTKADIASDEELRALEQVARSKVQQDIDIIEIGSEEKKLRNGKVIKPFGRDHLVESLADGFIKGVKFKFDARCRARFRLHWSDWTNQSLEFYDSRAGFFKRTAPVLESVKTHSDALMQKEMRSFDAWMDRMRKRLSEISDAFSNVMHSGLRLHLFHHSRSASDSITWKSEDKATDYIMAAIPLINVAYSFTRTSIHRDYLEEKLKAIADDMVANFELRLDQEKLRR